MSNAINSNWEELKINRMLGAAHKMGVFNKVMTTACFLHEVKGFVWVNALKKSLDQHTPLAYYLYQY